MFDNIAENYDRLNHLLSFGLDKRWRKIYVKNIPLRKYETIVDVASGTGDLLVELQTLKPAKQYAVDPSSNMIKIAKEKLPQVKTIIAGAEKLPFKDNSIDLITVAFGVRNFSNIDMAFAEFDRTLTKNGIVSIMEFSKPKSVLFTIGHNIYLKFFIPLIGGGISKDRNAYEYLQTSIFEFNKNVNIRNMLIKRNFKIKDVKHLMLGAVNIITVEKA